MAESRSTPSIGFSTVKAAPSCDTVYGVQSEDTCFGIAQTFKLTTEFFDSINPNINCAAIFVGGKMAKANIKLAMFLYMVVVVSFLLTIKIAESRSTPSMAKAAPSCDTVFGVRSGDTCFGIVQTFKLTTEFFDSINPNLNCTAMFAAGLTGGRPTPHCNEVLSVESGDTCFAITQAFNMTTAFFDAINPNLNCRKLFVGEWLCIAGTVN
ncbi:hypothetical protein RJ639_009840 [Escallonia herrerae]|uniref:LysM domain-containing protein n=1 Tax=Escallonia herrerae TaxID=1293975 RepID=A0AA88VTD6_9ASTE|nr:hypothetical protein RJ639_009840 [Escallonia herrerae]